MSLPANRMRAVADTARLLRDAAARRERKRERVAYHTVMLAEAEREYHSAARDYERLVLLDGAARAAAGIPLAATEVAA